MFVMFKKEFLGFGKHFDINPNILNDAGKMIELIDIVISFKYYLLLADTLEECQDFVKTEQYKELKLTNSEVLILEVNIKVINL